MPAVSKLTKYDNFFKNTYWGRFASEQNTSITQEIIANRNKFIEIEGIRSHVTKVPRYVYKALGQTTPWFDRTVSGYDHVEVYDAGDRYVVISSPYAHVKTPHPGFAATEPLYSDDANTFIARVNKRGRDTSPVRRHTKSK